MSLRISNNEARELALELTKKFVAVKFANQTQWAWQCWEPQPAVLESSYKQRKTIVKWTVAVRLSRDGSEFDGGPIVLVNIQTKDVCFR